MRENVKSDLRILLLIGCIFAAFILGALTADKIIKRELRQCWFVEEIGTIVAGKQILLNRCSSEIKPLPDEYKKYTDYDMDGETNE